MLLVGGKNIGAHMKRHLAIAVGLLLLSALAALANNDSITITEDASTETLSFQTTGGIPLPTIAANLQDNWGIQFPPGYIIPNTLPGTIAFVGEPENHDTTLNEVGLVNAGDQFLGTGAFLAWQSDVFKVSVSGLANSIDLVGEVTSPTGALIDLILQDVEPSSAPDSSPTWSLLILACLGLAGLGWFSSLQASPAR
jgi:hypothetical protein